MALWMMYLFLETIPSMIIVVTHTHFANEASMQCIPLFSVQRVTEYMTRLTSKNIIANDFLAAWHLERLQSHSRRHIHTLYASDVTSTILEIPALSGMTQLTCKELSQVFCLWRFQEFTDSNLCSRITPWTLTGDDQTNGHGTGGHLPTSNSASSLHHLTTGTTSLGPPTAQTSGSSIGDVASSTDLQHKVNAIQVVLLFSRNSKLQFEILSKTLFKFKLWTTCVVPSK